ncbi:uncharacterized protein [Diadema antillarum]|uniref:uncharacterized protein n=1 Tax=Diadema antillarum TaxID=105358 RepID=UPI003A8B51C7
MPVDTKPKIHEGRKSSKPLMEKRRRARINDSLSQLKSLILEATNKDSSRHSKLEKADILEMTVKHLRTVQRNHLAAPRTSDPSTVSRFRQGYSECIHEVARFFTNIENMGNADMRLSLINHLANCCNPPTSSSPPATQPSPPTSPVSVSPIAPLHVGQPTVTVPSPAIAAAAVNPALQGSQPVKVQISPAGTVTTSTALTTTTNIAASPVQQQFVQHHIEAMSPTATNTVAAATPAQVVSGIPVGIPGTLPSGEITLVLPPQALAGGQLPSHFIPVYAQSLASPTISPATASGPISAESPKAYAQVHLNTHQQITAVQAPTLVAVPAPSQAATPVTRQVKPAQQTVPEPQSPPKTVLQAVNVQAVVEQEQVWRPWSRRE